MEEVTELYVAAKDFSINGIKSKITKGTQVERCGDYVKVRGKQYEVQNVDAAIRDGLLVPFGTPLDDKPPSDSISARIWNPYKGVMEHQELPIEVRGGTTRSGMVNIPKGNQDDKPWDFKNIPVKGAEPQFAQTPQITAQQAAVAKKQAEQIQKTLSEAQAPEITAEDWAKLTLEKKLQMIPRLMNPKLINKLALGETVKKVKNALLERQGELLQ